MIKISAYDGWYAFKMNEDKNFINYKLLGLIKLMKPLKKFQI